MSIRDLEKELGIGDALGIEGSLITVRVEQRRYGKNVTVLTGFDPSVDVDALGKELKHALGTGGTVKDGTIELQGHHLREVRPWLEKKGYPLAK
jgi:translation initiation factor 1